MSYKVKPEDVPSTLAIELQDNLSGVTIHAYRSNISKILNAAIEAGLVSPPCHVVVWPSGNLVMQEPGEPVRVFPGKGGGPHCQHYKGQTS